MQGSRPTVRSARGSRPPRWPRPRAPSRPWRRRADRRRCTFPFPANCPQPRRPPRRRRERSGSP